MADKLAEDRRTILQHLWGDRGCVIVETGLAPRSDIQVLSAAWNLFTALCQPLPQYRSGELVHTVEVATQQIPGASHYSQSNKSGGYHTDGTLLDTPPDIAMLAGISTADHGGETVIVDGRPIIVELVKTCSEKLSILEGVHPFHSGDISDPLVMHHVIDRAFKYPVIRYMRQYVELGYTQTGRQLPDELAAAFKILDSLTNNPRHQVAVMVNRGLALLWNNTRCLHGRKPFKEVNQRRRLMRTYGARLKADYCFIN